MSPEWGFLLDENVERRVAEYLRQEGHRADLVVDDLGPGVDDLPDVLPYAVEHDLLLVTKDVSDFGSLEYGDHEGIILIYDHAHSAYEIATGLFTLVGSYGTRNDLRHIEVLEDWL